MGINDLFAEKKNSINEKKTTKLSKEQTDEITEQVTVSRVQTHSSGQY